MLARKLVLLASLATSTALHAATEFPGGFVPMDVVREFAGGTLYQSVPDGFPPITLPAGIDLRFVASTSEGYSQKVVLRTALGRDALFEQLRTALAAQGWLDVSSGPITYQLRLCHDQYGTLYVGMNSPGTGTSRVDVTRSTFPTSATCRDQQAQVETSAGWSAFYSARFPALETPPAAVTTNPAPSIIRNSSSSSSGQRVEMNSGGNLEVPNTTAADLHTYFAQQMQSQGWQMDSSAAGARSATSVWVKVASAPGLARDPVEMLVTLSVLHGSGDVYGVAVKLQSPPDASGGSGFYSSIF